MWGQAIPLVIQRSNIKEMPNHFETIFCRFIESIGGDVVACSEEESADFVFREDKVVIELKTIERDQRFEHAQRLGALANDWGKRGRIRVHGTTVLDLQHLHPECQREWLHLLKGPIEGIIRKAHRQIRSTKSRETLPDAKGLLLILNDGNFLHTAPTVFMNLVARVLQKKAPGGGRKFPEVRGVVYFSFRVAAAGESNLFWVQGTIEPEEDSALQAFQTRLRREWYAHFARLIGRPVSENPG